MMKSGQILILVLLVVVVALATGLSVASRNITNLRISTQTEESQRAFSAAEGGVEDVLSKLKIIADEIGAGTGTECTISSDEANCEVVIDPELTAFVNVKGTKIYEIPLVDLGEVAQVDLEGWPSASAEITVEWIKRDEPSQSPSAALEFTFVCENSVATLICDNLGLSDYSQGREFYRGPGAYPDLSGATLQTCGAGGVDYVCSATFNVDSSDNLKLLRIRPFYNATSIKVSGSPDLPTQIYEINSTAATDLGQTRKIQVERTVLPILPAMFDYALYSEGDIVK